jgi:hypothetical protein
LGTFEGFKVRYLPLVLAAAIVLSSGLVHGLWTNRWGRSEDMERAVGSLERIPMDIGDYSAKAQQLDPKQVALGEIAGYLYRRYTNRLTGRTVSVLLLCGRSGPLSVHQPQVCLGGAGYEMIGAETKYSPRSAPPGRSAEFWTAQFAKPAMPESQRQQVLWAWNATGDWRAPKEDPRWTFAGQRVLFKLYLSRETSGAKQPLKDDSAAEFLPLLLAEVDKALFPNTQRPNTQ